MILKDQILLATLALMEDTLRPPHSIYQQLYYKKRHSDLNALPISFIKLNYKYAFVYEFKKHALYLAQNSSWLI